MRDFRELKVWQAGHRLALDLYKLTAGFPRAEMYGLTAQIRRAAVSVGANIAEGSTRISDPGMRQFLVIAHGSVAELQYLVLIATDLGYLDKAVTADIANRTRDLRRMLNGFIRRLGTPKLRRTADG
jgi:four helix bundle protein